MWIKEMIWEEVGNLFNRSLDCVISIWTQQDFMSYEDVTFFLGFIIIFVVTVLQFCHIWANILIVYSKA